MAFISTPNIYMSSFDHLEKDVTLKGLGYDNMNITKPFNFVRIQDYHTLHIVLSGSGHIKIADKTTPIHAGDMFYVPPGIRFFYHPDKNNKWEYVWFNFVGKGAKECAQKLGLSAHKPVAQCKNFSKICSMMIEILGKYERNEKVGYYEALSSLFKVIELNNRSHSKNMLSLSERAKDFVNQNYFNSNLTITGICNHLNVSHSYMCRIFKRDNDITLKNYIINKRIHEACRLLKETDLEIKEIVYSVGFLDVVHFMKIFKKYVGTSPKRYRQLSEIPKQESNIQKHHTS